MKAQSFFLAASVVTGALAVPVQERDVVMYTVTQDVVDIVSITSTVWVSPSEYTAAPAAVESAATSAPAAVAYTPAASNHRHGHAHSHKSIVASSSAPAAVYTPPTSTPVAVAPTTTSVPETPSSTPTPTLPSTTSTIPTSTYVAPTTSSTSSVYTPPAPTTSSTSSLPIAIPTTLIPVVSTSSYVAPVASSTPSTGGSYGGGGSEYSGEATYYAPGLGSCGDTNDSSELIVAISHTLMDAAGGSNGNPLCGKQIKATASDTGKSVTVSVKDRCVGCAEGDLDFTETGFEQLGHALGDGRFDITWSYVS